MMILIQKKQHLCNKGDDPNFPSIKPELLGENMTYSWNDAKNDKDEN